MDAIVDNDILLKVACFQMFEELILRNCLRDGSVGILGAARFVVLKKIQKSVHATIANAAKTSFAAFIDVAETIEPSTDEQLMAADFELAAQRSGVALDSGESQLCAVLIARTVPLLLTGDKRAIRALEILLDKDSRLDALSGNVRCLEQLILRPLSVANYSQFRIAVCRQPEVDRTLSICFSCRATEATFEGITEGLNSYIHDLRSQASRILAP